MAARDSELSRLGGRARRCRELTSVTGASFSRSARICLASPTTTTQRSSDRSAMTPRAARRRWSPSCRPTGRGGNSPPATWRLDEPKVAHRRLRRLALSGETAGQIAERVIQLSRRRRRTHLVQHFQQHSDRLRRLGASC